MVLLLANNNDLRTKPYLFFCFLVNHYVLILSFLHFQHDNKCIIDPKIKIWSSFNHPHVCMTSFLWEKQMLKTVKTVVLDPPGIKQSKYQRKASHASLDQYEGE